MQCVCAARGLVRRVFIGRNAKLLAVHLKGAVLDAIGVTARHSAQMGVRGVDAVVCGIVEACDNVAFDAILVADQEVGDGSAVGDEGGLNAPAADPILAVLVRLWRDMARVGAAGAVVGGARQPWQQPRCCSQDGQRMRRPLHGSICLSLCFCPAVFAGR